MGRYRGRETWIRRASLPSGFDFNPEDVTQDLRGLVSAGFEIPSSLRQPEVAALRLQPFQPLHPRGGKQIDTLITIAMRLSLAGSESVWVVSASTSPAATRASISVTRRLPGTHGHRCRGLMEGNTPDYRGLWHLRYRCITYHNLGKSKGHGRHDP